jgi:hypothetical protein
MRARRRQEEDDDKTTRSRREEGQMRARDASPDAAEEAWMKRG